MRPREVSTSHGARYCSQRPGIERRRHHHELQIGPEPLLQFQRAREGDVAVEMPLVKFVEDDRTDAAQLRIGEHLPQEHALGNEADPRLCGAHAIQPDLIADFLPEPSTALLRHARREHPRRQPARLEHDDLATPRQAVIEQHLRHLRRFSGAGRRLQHEPGMLAQGSDERGFEFVDGKHWRNSEVE